MSTTTDQGHLLLVDDDEMIRMLASESLQHAGFTVSEAGDGDAALRLVAEQEFDLLLLDVVRPGIDGYDVCRAIRRSPRGQSLPIMMLTGLNDTESIERAYAAGATDFVTKPINWLLLTQRVRYGLRAGRAQAAVRHGRESLERAQRLARMGSWEWSLALARFSCSEQLRRICDDIELTGSSTPERFLERVQRSDRAVVAAARQRLMSEGTPYQATYGLRRGDGSLVEVFEEAIAIRDAAGRIVKLEGITQDISELVQAQRRIEHLALHDQLTGLANRQFFNELVTLELERAQRVATACAIIHIDLDHFKSFNDALGDASGDRLLCGVAERLQRFVSGREAQNLKPPMRAHETVARIDGDSFALLLVDLVTPEHAALYAERLLQAVAQPMMVAGRELVLTACSGIAVHPRDGDSAESLWRHAEQAVYAAKTAGPSSNRFFADEMNAAASAKLELEGDLRQAIAGEGLRLYFQPKVDVASGRMIGAEALLRWQHPRRGLLGPLHFIPLAEECGLIVALGDWVVAAAASHLRAWADAGIETVSVSVNLASPSFLQPDIVDRLVGIVQRAGVAPRQIVLELTESLLMVDSERTIAVLDRLREQGFGLSLDDFGTGYSSLSYLKRFPLDELKIDRSFVTDASGDSKDAAIVLSIIELGRRFGMRVVAEGVETGAQARFLLANGCPVQQGFLFSRPLPAEDFSVLLRSSRGHDFRRQLTAAG